MFKMKRFGTAIVALGLVLSAHAFAASEHSHETHATTALQLTLNNNQKWPTDEALRRGMGEMRNAMVLSLGRIHAGQFTPADYVSLAERLQRHVDYVIANCNLPEEADEQLHLLLAELLDSMEVMKEGADRSEGARRVVAALEAYGQYFADPSWTSIAP